MSQPAFQPASHPASRPASRPASQLASKPMRYKEANTTLFVSILSCLLPFYASTADGDTNLARAAIAEMIEACRAATPAEFDLAGRLWDTPPPRCRA